MVLLPCLYAAFCVTREWLTATDVTSAAGPSLLMLTVVGMLGWCGFRTLTGPSERATMVVLAVVLFSPMLIRETLHFSDFWRFAFGLFSFGLAAKVYKSALRRLFEQNFE